MFIITKGQSNVKYPRCENLEVKVLHLVNGEMLFCKLLEILQILNLCFYLPTSH